ncbi:MAG: FAD-dependent oxidoreductase [Burkholderiales bacterium]|nr:FAD-dependent oxidoreductase [Burkholderiales bacterium]
MKPIVIIGAGLAGYSVAREFRKLDREHPLVLIAADDADFYTKPMLSNAFASGKTPAALVGTPAARMAAQLGLVSHARTRVTAIDRGRGVLVTDRGELEYGRLVCALGAEPVSLRLTGSAAEEVRAVNSLSDYAHWRSRLEHARTVAIIGAGLIGCEFANDLALAGYRVSVIDPSPHPLASLLPPAAGCRLQEALAGIGIDWRLGIGVGAVDRHGAGVRLILGDATAVEADLVLSAVGLRPSIGLATAAGLATGRGVQVDARLRSTDPHIFALGDCAEIDGEVRNYVAPIMHAARALARTLAGSDTAVAFPPMPVIVKTPCEPLVVLPAPRAAPGRWLVEAEDGGLKMVFRDAAERMLGFVLTGARVSERNVMTQGLALAA